jgi:rhamnosyltransferase
MVKPFEENRIPQSVGDSIDISIVIPAKNEAANITSCLQAVFDQKTDYSFEVIVIDSGSTDGTPGIVLELSKSFSSLTLLKIEPEEFGHGKTRNLGAETARGEFLIFLNADALPVDRHWMDELIAPMVKGEDGHGNKVAGVFSRHLPKEGCHLYMVRDIYKMMPESPPDDLRMRRKAATLDFMLFSTVSCAMRRETWGEYSFDDDIIIAEDQQWARSVLDAGYTICYEPESMVYHSHNYAPSQLYDIKRRVGRATGRFSNRFSAVIMGFILMTAGILVKFAGDVNYILFKYQDSMSVTGKRSEVLTALKARTAGFLGRYRGWRESVNR